MPSAGADRLLDGFSRRDNLACTKDKEKWKCEATDRAIVEDDFDAMHRYVCAPNNQAKDKEDALRARRGLLTASN